MLTEHTVDLAVLTRDELPLSQSVSAALREQRGVKLRIHRIIGKPQAGDANRVATIVRARNEAVRCADRPG